MTDNEWRLYYQISTLAMILFYPYWSRLVNKFYAYVQDVVIKKMEEEQ
jgi:hypothetical protein